jgi:4-amino-4-deoxy-L-arabinose transferase-like glycosyltransferase
MTENDRWGAHLEYFKLSIALTTALIAAAAAIYFDFAKIPTDYSRYILLVGVVLFSITLGFSVLGVAKLGNYLLYVPRDTTTPAAAQTATAAQTAAPTAAQTATPTAAQIDDMNRLSRLVVKCANVSFFSLVAAVIALGWFFWVRTFQIAEASFERAIASALIANRNLVDATKGETVTLKSLDLQGNNYQLTFQISPGPGTTTIVTDGAGTKVTSARRQ